MVGSEYFKSELKNIKNEVRRAFISRCLDSLPQYFWEIPASSTGKYHPEYSLGEGGLARHVKAAVNIAMDILHLKMFSNVEESEKDAVIGALLLHDGLKSGWEHSEYTRFDHPTLMSNQIYKWFSEFGTKDIEEWVKCVASAVASHMGEWNTNAHEPYSILPLPETSVERFVHMCDYLASRKYLEVNFDKMEF